MMAPKAEGSVVTNLARQLRSVVTCEVGPRALQKRRLVAWSPFRLGLAIGIDPNRRDGSIMKENNSGV